MCIVINKWRTFEPTKQYLSIVSGLTSVDRLHSYLKQFKWQGEKGDHWKTPMEFIENKDKNNDCEDFARFTVDVLFRVMDKIGARFVIHSGYNKEIWGNKCKCHAITVFPYEGKLAVFSNNRLYKGIDSFEDAGKILFVDGLKYQEVRSWQGKVFSKRRKWIGTF